MHREFDAHPCGGDLKPIRGNSVAGSVPHDADSITIGELARSTGVTLRALRFYQSKGLLAPQRDGSARIFSHEDRERLDLILQGKRLGFTLFEIHDMLTARDRGCAKSLPISRKKCIEQIRLLENQRRDLERALSELRAIYTGMFRDLLTLAVRPLPEVSPAELP